MCVYIKYMCIDITCILYILQWYYIQKISGEFLQKFSRKQYYVTCLLHNTLYLETPYHYIIYNMILMTFIIVVSNKDVSFVY